MKLDRPNRFLARACSHLNVKANVLVPFVVGGVESGDELIALDSGVLRQCPGHRLEGLGELLDGVLLQTWAGLKHRRTAMMSADCFTCAAARPLQDQ